MVRRRDAASIGRKRPARCRRTGAALPPVRAISDGAIFAAFHQWCSYRLPYLCSELTNVVTETIFRIAWFVKASLHQLLDSCLSGGPLHGSNERVPLRRDVRICRQTGNVDQMLRFADSLLIKRRYPHRKRIDKTIKVGIGQ